MDSQPQTKQEIQGALSKSQYGVGPLQFHTHNGVDSPTLSFNAIPSLTGRSWNPGTTSIGINKGGQAIKLNFSTNDFANGIAWDSANSRFICATPANYLVSGQVYFTSTPNAAEQFYFLIYKNGAEVSRGQGVTVNGGDTPTPKVADIITLVTNDYIEYYMMRLSNSGTVSIDPASGKTFGIIMRA